MAWLDVRNRVGPGEDRLERWRNSLAHPLHEEVDARPPQGLTGRRFDSGPRGGARRCELVPVYR